MPTWLLVVLLIGQIFIGFFAAMTMMFMACAENAPTLSKRLDRVLVNLWADLKFKRKHLNYQVLTLEPLTSWHKN